MIPNYVVLSTHDRPEHLIKCIESISDADLIVIIDNASAVPAIGIVGAYSNVYVIRDDQQPPNLSRLWNLGIEFIEIEAYLAGFSEWNVFVINDDIVAPIGWLYSMSNGLRSHPTAVLAYPDQFSRSLKQPIVHTSPKTISAFDRIVGYAHVMRGETGLRYDEQFEWWYGDDDLDWTARGLGGSILVPGNSVEHKLPNHHTNTIPALAERAGIDRELFIEKWGSLPC